MLYVACMAISGNVICIVIWPSWLMWRINGWRRNWLMAVIAIWRNGVCVA